MKNSVFIATSSDGYIATTDGNIDWLHSVPNQEGNDMGYHVFISNIDAIVMGRKTFDIVCGFDIEWPYEIPVFVMSNTINQIPEALKGKVEVVSGSISEILKSIHSKGFYNLYIDGGKTIQSFLKEEMIDEMIITIIPVTLGSGIPLFLDESHRDRFKKVDSKIYLDTVVQNYFVRKNK